MGFHRKEWGELCNFILYHCWAFHFWRLHIIVLSLCEIALLPWSFKTFGSCAFALLPTKLSFFLVYVCGFRVASFLAYVCSSKISKVLLMHLAPKLPVFCLCVQLQSFHFSCHYVQLQGFQFSSILVLLILHVVPKLSIDFLHWFRAFGFSLFCNVCFDLI